MTAVKADLCLSVRSLEKTYGTAAYGRRLFRGLNLDLGRSERVAVLGRNGQGKSTFIKMLGGVLPATAGTISWFGRPSWPIGFGGGFQGSLTGMDNIKFISRLYEKEPREVLERVDDFAELGAALHRPVKHYSSGMRARLAFGLSLAIDFDCYLIDELVAVGDARFQERCNRELFEVRADRAFLMASHDMSLIRSKCDRGIVIDSGRFRMFSDIDEAVDVYMWLKA